VTYPKFVRGFKGYALILRILLDNPMTLPELTKTLDTDPSGLRTMFAQFRARRLVHVHSWVKDAQGRTFVARWAPFDGPDAPIPNTKRGKPGRERPTPSKRNRTELTAFCTMLDCLQEPCTYHMLVEQTGVTYGVINRCIRFMRELRLVHIGAWDRTLARAPTAMFKLGDKRNADRPKPETREQSIQKWNEIKRVKRESARMMKALAGQMKRLPTAGSYGFRDVQ